MTEAAQSGHVGGPLGGADFIAMLYAKHLAFDPKNPSWNRRDRFFLDAGHLSVMLYATHYLFGMYTEDDLRNFRQLRSHTPGHPELDLEHGIENTSGPLGLGHAMAVGTAIAEQVAALKYQRQFSRVFSYITDGGVQEEISQGVGRVAGHLALKNFILFYDSNGVQLSTKVCDVSHEATVTKYRAWGWNTVQVDGHNLKELDEALLSACAEIWRPTIIIGKTTIAKYSTDESGTGSFEGLVETHGQPLSKVGASPAATIKALGGDPDKPFAIFDDVKETIAQIAKSRVSESLKYYREPVEVPVLTYGKSISTRSASGDILAHFAMNSDRFICLSADMCTTDYSIKFLERCSGPITCNNWLGRFLQVGVSELTMAALANGIALQGDFIPICSTYLVFSDYMKPAIRLAAMMGLPVKYVFTHDDFRVGEDGPTHQPVEHELQLRLLEKITKNGFPTLLVFRPADAFETQQAWSVALKYESVPTAFIFSRQSVPQLQLVGNVDKGAYVVNCEPGATITLIANGSDVHLAIGVAHLLSSCDVKCSVVSVPSIGLFLQQPKEYQDYVIPSDELRYGITSGLALNLLELVKDPDCIFSMKTFGASAPVQQLEKEFGFMPQNICDRILKRVK